MEELELGVAIWIIREKEAEKRKRVRVRKVVQNRMLLHKCHVLYLSLILTFS